MSSWGNNDTAANTPFWAATAVHLAPTSANATSLYENTTANAFISGQTTGLFLVDSAEIEASSGGHGSGAAAGWVLRTTGTGGRAGRVQQETLVALAGVKSDNNADDTLYPDAVITISQPAAIGGPVSAASGDSVTFSVEGTTVVPSTATLSYQWQVNNNTGGTWVDIDPGTGVTTGEPGNVIKTGANTATLVLDPTVDTANNYVFRAVITATNPGIAGSTTTAYSANGRILITA